jgi:hypothetical protein
MVEALNAPPISYWTMYGLNMLVHLVFDKPTVESDEQFKRLTLMLDACIPDEKRTEMNETLRGENESMAARVGGLVFGQALANTVSASCITVYGGFRPLLFPNCSQILF